jgi:beta-1,4-mannooligosaccharide/beta-1,4-mannosyl-N-acetylglucosamine phosphorylase
MKLIGELKSSLIIKRYPGNPILSARDVPYKPALVFNAGVTKYQGKYVMAFRNDYGVAEEERLFPYVTDIGLAFSDDGIRWQVEPKPCFSFKDEETRRAYDPRLTVIDGRCYMCFAVDAYYGTRGAIAVTDDFRRFEILCMTTAENRNLVLFPEKVNGMFVRLERPFVWSVPGGNIWIANSPDCRYWGDYNMLLRMQQVPFANFKIGPAAPPVKTKKGWLTTFHAVDDDPSRGKNGWEDRWTKRYTAGIMLLDLENPRRIIGLYKEPLIAPEAPYETDGGYRNNVVFASGMILEDAGEVKIYYGAADTVECLATADVGDLIRLYLT